MSCDDCFCGRFLSEPLLPARRRLLDVLANLPQSLVVSLSLWKVRWHEEGSALLLFALALDCNDAADEDDDLLAGCCSVIGISKSKIDILLLLLLVRSRTDCFFDATMVYLSCIMMCHVMVFFC